MPDGRHSGFTLIELALVVAILVILAGLVLPSLWGMQENTAATATVTSLQSLRACVIGDGRPGYLADVGQLPGTVGDLFVMPPRASPFNPMTRCGWHGPYLQNVTGTYQANPGAGFLATYVRNGDGNVAVLDAWGSPIVLQAPITADPKQRDLYTRLVSAGPDGVISTDPNILYPTPDTRGDDVVLFLMRPDVMP